MLTSVDPSRIGFALGAVCAAGVSAALIRNLLLGRASRSWPVVVGRMLDANIRVASRPSWSWHATTLVTEHVRYAYTVDGETYESDRRGYASRTMDEAYLPYAAKLRMQRYHPGATVEVRYDPRKPERSVLEPGVTPWSSTVCVFALAITLLLTWLAAFP